MKKKTIAIGVVILLLAVGLSGCEELKEELDKPDYITVTVNCLVYIWISDAGDMSAGKDVVVRVEIIKAGGERVSELRGADSYGTCEKVTGTFKLYREQSITCIVNVILTSVEQNYSDYTFDGDSETIYWDDIYPSSDFGESTEREIVLQPQGERV